MSWSFQIFEPIFIFIESNNQHRSLVLDLLLQRGGTFLKVYNLVTPLASGVRCNLCRCFSKHWIPTRWYTQPCCPESNLNFIHFVWDFQIYGFTKHTFHESAHITSDVLQSSKCWRWRPISRIYRNE
jgi:hypothetical protein